MGELIRIAEYLQTKHYPTYCWIEERTRYIPLYSGISWNFLEDGHGYSLFF